MKRVIQNNDKLTTTQYTMLCYLLEVSLVRARAYASPNALKRSVAPSLVSLSGCILRALLKYALRTSLNVASA